MESLPLIRLGWPVSNVWLLPRTDIGPVLVDAGMAALWPVIRHGLRRQGVVPGDLAAVLLTHRHSDHAGNAARLHQEYGVPIWAHPADGEVLRGKSPLPRLKPDGMSVTAWFCRLENRFPARTVETRPLEEGDVIAGLEVHWVPGHTAGSVFLYHRSSGTLFTGDMLLNGVPPLITRTRLCLPFPPFCDDYARAIESLDAFQKKDLDVRLLCPGHGPMRRGPIGRGLNRLLEAERAKGDSRGT
ncbi:MAG: MBL fold metallo-hydrolase [Bradymonadales bacterium]|nr:MBL fold metallo-hydrolase [Bradymonadales bacterium]